MKYRVGLAIGLLVIVLVSSFVLCPPQDPASAAPPASEKKGENPPVAASVALRLRRTVYEDAYVAVPVTDAVMKKKADGTFGIDFDALAAEAIRIGKDPRVEWKVESSEITAHPTQKPRPENRRSFDPSTAEPDKRANANPKLNEPAE